MSIIFQTPNVTKSLSYRELIVNLLGTEMRRNEEDLDDDRSNLPVRMGFCQ